MVPATGGNRVRKALWAAAAAALLALAACGGGSDVVAGSEGEAPEGTWLTTVVTEGGSARELVEPGHLSLQFFPDGRVSAGGGCNGLSGTLRLDDGRFWIDDAGSTTRARR